MKKATANVLFRLTVTVFVLLIIGGCNSTSSLADRHSDNLDQIPVPNNLTIYEGPEEYTFDALIVASKQAFETQPNKLETQFYWMPETLTWEQIEQFLRRCI